MVEEMELADLYNLKIIHISKLFSKIEESIYHFIVGYNLKVSIKSKDFKNILNHFIINSLLSEMDNIKSNVFIKDSFKPSIINELYSEEDFISNLEKHFSKVSNKFKLNIKDSLLGEDNNYFNNLRNFSKGIPKSTELLKFIRKYQLKEIESTLHANYDVKLKIMH